MANLELARPIRESPEWCSDGRFSVRAVLLGERLDTRTLDTSAPGPTTPLRLTVGAGSAVLFRYGAAVFFALSQPEERLLLDRLRPHVINPLPVPESEEATIIVRGDAEEVVEPGGIICLKDASPERLQIVANILSKSIVLAYYEAQIAAVFDRIEPLAERLQRSGRTGSQPRRLMQQIGEVLLIQHRMVGRVEVGEKPEVLWDVPGLERLYARLEDEYELAERSKAIDRKLELINETSATLLELVQDRRSLRLEWYVILLIAAEIVLSLYEIFVRPH